RGPGAVGGDDPVQVARAAAVERDGAAPGRPHRMAGRPVRRRQVQAEPAPRPAFREHAQLQARGRPALDRGAGARAVAPSRPRSGDATMPSDETRRLLKLFGVAVTNLEDAIDRRAPLDEIAKWDQEVAERTRETIAFVERLRSRRVG